jgi:membrane protease YdiL (CAAX protease family)
VSWRLIGWCALVVLMSALAYAAQLSSGPPEKDVAYQWSSSILGAVQYAFMFGIVMLLTRGLDRRRFLALRPPRTTWWRAAGIGAGVLVAVFIVSAIVAQFANAEREQGLIPEHWNSGRAAPFAAFCVLVVVIAPIVEELLFRGVGYALLARFGQYTAVVLVGLSFALVHGLIAGFAVIAVFGAGLAYLRAKTDSIYPGMLLHASFNAFGLAIGIATGG